MITWLSVSFALFSDVGSLSICVVFNCLSCDCYLICAGFIMQ